MSFSITLPKSSSDKIKWGNLPGSATSLLIAQAALQHANSTVLITPTMTLADKLSHEIGIMQAGRDDALEVIHFADWETLPYDNFSPHQDIISDRMRCLYQLAQGQKSIVVVAAPTLMQRLPPTDYLIAHSLVLKTGDTLTRDKFAQRLSQSGYSSVDTVFQHGEFALRGALIDVYPMGSSNAYRIELFDDEVDSLREFDTETQRTIQQVESIELLPGKECPTDQQAIGCFKENWYAHFDVDAKACPVFQDVSSGLSPAGIEYYLPLFFDKTANFFDYLPEESLLLVCEGVNQAVEDYYRDITPTL